MRLTARKLATVFVASAAVLLIFGEAAYAQTDKPNGHTIVSVPGERRTERDKHSPKKTVVGVEAGVSLTFSDAISRLKEEK